jgi:hypothetical protein
LCCDIELRGNRIIRLPLFHVYTLCQTLFD